MPVTFTIKQVPDQVAEGLRRRAEANHRSLQRELLLIVERAASGEPAPGNRIAEPVPAPYSARATGQKTGKAARTPAAGKLSLQQLWQRARQLGAPMPGESAAIVRRDRDARHGR